MRILELSPGELLDRLRGGSVGDELLEAAGAVVVLVPEGSSIGVPAELVERVGVLPAIVVGPRALAPAVDLIPEREADVDALTTTVTANPHAATALAMLLRHSEGRSVAEGLLAESAVYSMLQGGPEFAAWLAERPWRARRPEEGPAVMVERDGARLELRLNRPARHNALDVRLREEWLDGLAVAALDPTVREVHIRGEGASFCSGGDLDEFGTSADPPTAHLVRVARNIGAAVDALADRVVVHLHGACVGSGIEIPAFAGRVIAAPDTNILLPEVALGLVPGAGGTVSLPRRIGRHRTALLALTGRRLDAPTALSWGLVDELEAGSV